MYQDNPTWRTRDGRVIPIKDMENSHLINSIWMLIKNGKTRAQWYLPLLDEAAKRQIFGEFCYMSNTDKHRLYHILGQPCPCVPKAKR